MTGRPNQDARTPGRELGRRGSCRRMLQWFGANANRAEAGKQKQGSREAERRIAR